jgi:uncharacterized protein YajQ (UPF0234 family)
MPSFDIVSRTDVQEVDNAINSVKREIDQRYDFKGSKCNITRDENDITLLADDNYKLDQMQQMLKGHIVRRNLDPKALEFKKVEQAAGNALRQKVAIKQGIESELAKKVMKEIKASKVKVQASIRGEELRVEGKKRDELQEIITLVKAIELELPLQFVNFRD